MKLTRAEACAELAVRMGTHRWLASDHYGFRWAATNSTDRAIPFHAADARPASGNEPINLQASDTYLPDFFTGHDAAAKLVAWLGQHDRNSDDPSTRNLVSRFINLLKREVRHDIDDRLALMIATPEQVTCAACAAMGIDMEDW